jgi:hypothetical protein
MRTLLQKPLFKRIYKKLTDKQRPEVNAALRAIATNPEIGQVKTADLADAAVYKFPVVDQQYLLAYCQESNGDIVLLALGVHENFYHDLKQNLR